MIEIGRICVKLAGRDAGRECLIVDVLDNNYVLIDGNVRRRKCNISHLEPTEKKIDIKKGASHEEVKEEFAKLNIPVWETKPKEKVEQQKGVPEQKEAAEEPKKKEKKEKIGKKEGADKEEEGKKEKPLKKEKKPIDARIISVTKKKKTSKKKEEKA